jgi:iron complex outermembrane receptor protein
VTTKKPGKELEGMVIADFGNYGYQRIGGLLSVPFSDTLAGKISVVKSERDGYLDNAFGGTVNTVDYVTSRAQLLWSATEKLEFTLTADYRQDDSDGNNLITQATGETPTKNYLVSIPDSGYEDVEAAGLALKIVYDWNDYQITSISSFNTIDEDYLNDNDWSALDALLTQDVRENEQWSQELRISSPGGERLNWVAGVYLYEQTFDALQNVENGPDTVFAAVGLGDLVGSGIPPSNFGLPDTIPIVATSTIEAESYAVYANVDYAFSDAFSVTGGLRYSTDKKTLDYMQRSAPIAAAFGFVELDITDSIDDGEWTPQVSLNWQIEDDVLLYAKYSRGYKAGGFNNSISSTGSAVAFDPETMDAYEIGLKSTWLEQRLRLNAAIFRMEYKDKQESAFVTGIGFVQTNAGAATSDGFEAELTYALRDNWTVYGALGYADATYDDYVIDEFSDNTGNKLVRAPEWTFNIGTEAIWSLGSALEMRARLDYSYQDEFFTQAGNNPFFAADSQGLLNVRLGLRSANQSWEATLWGRNLTDDDNINTIDGASTFFFPTYHYSLIAPRTYGLELKYSF